MVQSGRPQMAIWRMRIAYWVTKARDTHTHSEYVIRIAVPQQQWVCESVALLRYSTFPVSLLRKERLIKWEGDTKVAMQLKCGDTLECRDTLKRRDTLKCKDALKCRER